jgi:pyruvate/2-oxoglutarate/acetoin dehydrogenase E1 component/TPP-dependent pyruvate/acetoin dehydrogenase alpha subunit
MSQMIQEMNVTPAVTDDVQLKKFRQNVIDDYMICLMSREASLLGRKEVLTGKAKFGILGDGKEVPQVAMARAFRKGDWRSGYYRDQTFMMATGLSSIEDFFFQLYADTDNDPFSGGRQMNSHYATATVDTDGRWLNHAELYNVTADVSCTGGQMARALGIAMASKKYRQLDIPGKEKFSDHGNEVSFVTIGDSSTSEGVFWETVNAAAVMKVPLVVAVWDDGYGISVPVEMQTVKGSISKALEGFLINKHREGIYIYTVKGWDYAELCTVFEAVANKVREEHIPAIIHVTELTQPQGHSTSGSHERYKSAKRLEWEKEYDCIRKMGEWMVEHGIATESELEEMAVKAKDEVKAARDRAWKVYSDKVKIVWDRLLGFYQVLHDNYKTEAIRHLETEAKSFTNPVYAEIVQNARKLEIQLRRFSDFKLPELNDFVSHITRDGKNRYNTHLYSETPLSALNVPVRPAKYSDNSPVLNGYQILNNYFDQIMEHNPAVIAFGEDVGQIGDVNQGFAGMQLKYGKERVFDTGIREWTIVGQAIGGAMRGLRPIAEIQYLDYMAYAFSALSDDLATLRYRSNGIQCAPAIIRTRGHRLEGIWHAGSPMGMILTSMQGIYLCVPRNMVQAAGMYNTLMQSDDPGIVVECLNGYRLKEKLPDNLLEFTVPLGVPEILHSGEDVTLVTYGSCVREAVKAVDMLKGFGISVELIDVQTLMPFDLEGVIVNSLKKTGRIIFMDEDIPGGATAYMMRHVLEVQNGYHYLDSKPVCVTAAAHRTPFGSDGDYFTKPYAEDVFEAVYDMMKECCPDRF